MRRSLVLHRRLAYVRSRLLMHRRLAYVLSRLVLVRRGRRWSSARLWRRGMRRRTRSIVVLTRHIHRAIAMRSRLALVRVSRSGSVIRVRDIVGTVGVRCSGTIGIGSACTFGRASDIVIYRPRRLCAACIVCWARSIHRRIIRHWSITRPDHTCTAEGRRFRSCRHFGPAVIY